MVFGKAHQHNSTRAICGGEYVATNTLHRKNHPQQYKTHQPHTSFGIEQEIDGQANWFQRV
jgi:hypothetical protein